MNRHVTQTATIVHPTSSDDPPNKGELGEINGEEWAKVADLLLKPSSIAGLAERTGLTETLVEQTLASNSDKLREAIVSGPSGEPLFVRSDRAILPRVWEALHIFKLAAQ